MPLSSEWVKNKVASILPNFTWHAWARLGNIAWTYIVLPPIRVMIDYLVPALVKVSLQATRNVKALYFDKNSHISIPCYFLAIWLKVITTSIGETTNLGGHDSA